MTLITGVPKEAPIASNERTVWKIPLELTSGAQTVSIPDHCNLIHADLQGATPCVWAEVNPSNNKIDVDFMIVGTGHSIPDGDWMHVKSFLQDGGTFVWHLYVKQQ